MADLAARGFARVPGAQMAALMGEGGRAEALAAVLRLLEPARDRCLHARWRALPPPAHRQFHGRTRRAGPCARRAPAAFPGGGAQHAEWRRGPLVRADGGCGRRRRAAGTRCSISAARWRMRCTARSPGSSRRTSSASRPPPARPAYPTPEGVHHDGVDVVLIAHDRAHQPDRRRDGDRGRCRRCGWRNSSCATRSTPRCIDDPRVTPRRDAGAAGGCGAAVLPRRAGADLEAGLEQTPIRWGHLIGVICSTKQQARAGSVSQSERNPL